MMVPRITEAPDAPAPVKRQVYQFEAIMQVEGKDEGRTVLQDSAIVFATGVDAFVRAARKAQRHADAAGKQLVSLRVSESLVIR